MVLQPGIRVNQWRVEIWKQQTAKADLWWTEIVVESETKNNGITDLVS